MSRQSLLDRLLEVADGSYLFCWLETGREEVAVNEEIIGNYRLIHIHGPEQWRREI